MKNLIQQLKMTPISKFLFAVILLSCSILQACQVTAQTPNKVAQSMVKALKANHTLGERESFGKTLNIELVKGDTTAYVDSLNTARGIILATSGEILDGIGKLQMSMHIHGGFCARMPLDPEKVSMYLTRFRTIDKVTAEKWQTAQSKFQEAPSDISLIIGGIAFQDFLFEGGQWKTGNPEQVLMRMESIDKDSLTKWIEASKNVAPDYGSIYDAWALLAVDDLFVNNVFQKPVFDAAFPIAQKLLGTH